MVYLKQEEDYKHYQFQLFLGGGGGGQLCEVTLAIAFM